MRPQHGQTFSLRHTVSLSVMTSISCCTCSAETSSASMTCCGDFSPSSLITVSLTAPVCMRNSMRPMSLNTSSCSSDRRASSMFIFTSSYFPATAFPALCTAAFASSAARVAVFTIFCRILFTLLSMSKAPFKCGFYLFFPRRGMRRYVFCIILQNVIISKRNLGRRRTIRSAGPHRKILRRTKQKPQSASWAQAVRLRPPRFVY